MSNDALTLVRAKITEIEEKLAKLKVTESELKKLSGLSPSDGTIRPAGKRGRPAGKRSTEKVEVEESTETEPKKSVTARIRDYLGEHGATTAPSISENLGVETRPISFALQALKRKGEVKMKDGEWSLIGRRKKA